MGARRAVAFDDLHALSAEVGVISTPRSSSPRWTETLRAVPPGR